MSHDASAAASSPMTNGNANRQVNREADASSASAPLADICADLHTRVTRFLEAEGVSEQVKRTQEQARTSVRVIEKALQSYDFDALSFSYNGGKDCLVLLILYLATLHTHFSSTTGKRQKFPSRIPSIYAKPPDPFPQVTSFVESSSKRYHLDLVDISTNPGTAPTPQRARSHVDPPVAHDTASSSESAEKIVSFRDAFALYLSRHPQVRAIFVGTRRTDPHGAKLTHFDPTDGNWPAFMRIHPVIDWRLSEIWTFLRADELKEQDGRTLEYCSMYDEGYTSLGGVSDTLRNPKLMYIDENGKEKYKAAYVLVLDEEERLGRE